MRALFRGLYYQTFFEGIPQLALQWYILQQNITTGHAMGIESFDLYVSNSVCYCAAHDILATSFVGFGYTAVDTNNIRNSLMIYSTL